MIKVYLFQRLTLNLFVQVVEVPNVSWDDIGVPDEVGRLEVLRIHTKNMKLAEDVSDFLRYTYVVIWFSV